MTKIRKCGIVTALAVVGVCGAYAKQSDDRKPVDGASVAVNSSYEEKAQGSVPDRIKRILALAKKSAEEDGNVNFYGFFTGMSPYDAVVLAKYYKLKGGYEFSVDAITGRAVSRIWMSLKGVRRITRSGSTLDELAQAVVNQVGDMKYNRFAEDRTYERKTIDGVIVTLDSKGLLIQHDQVASQEAIATKEAMQTDRDVVKDAIQSIITNMVAIAGRRFKIGKYEVTQEQWGAVMGTNPSKFKGFNKPVERVRWIDCKRFLEKLNALPEVKASGLIYRLPTEVEWEYACRAGGTGEYCQLADGTEVTKDTLGKVAWYGFGILGGNSGSKTHPVGQKVPNGYGLYDMHGNVSEWCEEPWEQGSSYHVTRGGSFDYQDTKYKVSDRNRADDGLRYEYVGFRLVASTEADRAADRKAETEAIARVAEEAARKEREEMEAALKKQKEVVEGIIEEMIAIPGKNFKMGKYEVTQKQWYTIMDDTRKSSTQGTSPRRGARAGDDHGRSGMSEFSGDEYPVGGVNLDDCKVFLDKLNAMPDVKASGLRFRLPTEDEWKFACLAGGRKKYCRLANGTKIEKDTLDKVAWFDVNSGGVPHPIGQLTPNAFGLYDMHGNVYELCYGGRFYRPLGGGARSDARDCAVTANNPSGMSALDAKYRCGFRLAADQK